MYHKVLINSIRILPNDKKTFKTEDEFRYFICETMQKRKGLYYFPGNMMNCPINTLVLFQYNAKIRAIGILLEAEKVTSVDELGVSYSGYYKFDTDTLHYLKEPIDKEMLQEILPSFYSFNQSKQKISMDALESLLLILEKTNSIYFDNME